MPDTAEMNNPEGLGLKNHFISRLVLSLTKKMLGFDAFYKELSGNPEPILRRCDLREPALFAPIISATLALKDDPGVNDPLSRAATLILGARSLYKDINSAGLKPDMHRGQILEMGQYPNLFSTCQVVDGQSAHIFKSTERSQITVIVNSQIYILNVWPTDENPSVNRLRTALENLVLDANHSAGDAPGILTAASNRSQFRGFKKLRKVKINRDSLEIIKHSFLTVCLDLNEKPDDYAEAARMIHSSNYQNRWFHSSLQIVVFGNAKAGIICNFSTYLDGNTMVRAAAEIYCRSAELNQSNTKTAGNKELPPAMRLKWNFDPSILELAKKDLHLITDDQRATFEIQGIGKYFFQSHHLDPVSSFIVALQAALKSLTGKNVRIEQFLAMSKFRCMSLETAVVSTAEVLRMAELLTKCDGVNESKTSILQEALHSQRLACRKAREHLSSHIIMALFIRSKKGVKLFATLMVASISILFLRIMGMFNLLNREVIVSHPHNLPEVPIVGRPGIRLPYLKYFGLHYHILEDRIRITLMPSVKFSIPNEDVIESINHYLTKLVKFVESRSTAEMIK
ncbi:MAG: choline/carnitine O-acyltransferase, partial [Calditrichaceae bacterium]